jgi:protein phosphatase
VCSRTGPISLSTEMKDTFILLADLPSYQRAAVERTINARSLADAMAITERLRASVLPAVPEPEPEPTPTPSPTTTAVPIPAPTTEAPAL